MNTKRKRLIKYMCIGFGIAAVTPAAAVAAPDPLLPQQWALADPAAIGAQEAWTQSTGAGVLVAVLDTGVQLDHPDLAENVWTNPREIASNGRDDDANGIVDDVHGANMFDLSANVGDDNGHGTHVAGIIAARQANGIGGSGLAPDARILPVKVLDASMSGNTETLARGIRYAVDQGAKILNVSINTDSETATLKSAVRYAGERGAIIVASAGNNGRNIELMPSYPASLTDPAIFAVAATTASGTLWSHSNTGLLSVDVAAPGEHIIAAAPGSGYQQRTGTSAAAPFVSASLALLSAARPEAPMSALRDAIVNTSQRSNLLATLVAGGRLDVGAAMHRALPGTAWKSSDRPAEAQEPTLNLHAKSRAHANSRVTLRWTAIGADSVIRWRVSLDSRVIGTVKAQTAGVSRRIARTGSHKWRVVGYDQNGTKVVAGSRAFRIVRARRGAPTPARAS